jgi:hypothetical protein
MMDPRCSHLADDLILLDGDMRNNGEPDGNLCTVYTGSKTVDQDNTQRRSSLRVVSECRGADEKISFGLSSLQVTPDDPVIQPISTDLNNTPLTASLKVASWRRRAASTSRKPHALMTVLTVMTIKCQNHLFLLPLHSRMKSLYS